MTTSQFETELLVAGGGLSGVCCAIAAARNGAKVILLQDRPVLGGNASSEVRMHVVGASDRGKEFEVDARESGIIEEIRLEVAVRNPQRSATMFDLILLEKCRAEANLTLLLNTTLVGVTLDGSTIRKVLAQRQSTEDQFEITARVFADCTGDGRLGLEAGAEFRRGREAKSEFNEALAQDVADPYSLGSSLLYTARKHAAPMPFTPPPWARKFKKEHLRMRHPFSSNGNGPTYEYGQWWFEWGGMLDTIKDNETIRDELLAILLGVWDYIKNSGECPDSENWALDWFGFVPGKRESRRFTGPCILTQHDVENSTPFEDAIAFGGWPIDLHPPQGIDAVSLQPCAHHYLRNIYDIPLRACLSRNIENLVFAGRNISATHIAFASTRVMATCAAMGQGVGTASALAIKAGLLPKDLPANPKLLHHLKQRLLHDDAFVIGVVNDDPLDLARRATVTASSEMAVGKAAQVLSGQTRAIDGEKGAPKGRAVPGINRWMSQAEFPAWLELSWNEPVQIAEIRLVFDTGLHRGLLLTHSEKTHSYNRWGPQPETVKDYDLEVWDGTGWTMVERVKGNYQRLRVHRLDDPVEASRLRLVVHSTNGVPEARVCEVRVYSAE